MDTLKRLEEIGHMATKVNLEENAVLRAIEEKVKPVIRLLNKQIQIGYSNNGAAYHSERGINLLDSGIATGRACEQLWFTRKGTYLFIKGKMFDHYQWISTATEMTRQEVLDTYDVLHIIQAFKTALRDEIDNTEEKVGLLRKRLEDVKAEGSKLGMPMRLED